MCEIKRSPLFDLLDGVIRKNALHVVDWEGRTHRFGPENLRPVIIRLPDPAVEWQLLRHPRLGLGEAYMDGRIELLEGSLYEFLTVVANNRSALRKYSQSAKFLHIGRMLMRRLSTYNPPAKSHKNAAHYDTAEPFFKLFLDSYLQYSCGYYLSPDDDLETAQQNKMHYLARKLVLDKPGLNVLDIGCGWGGLSRFFAKEYGAKVDGITLSQEQLQICQTEQLECNLKESTNYRLQDYRHTEGLYDRIASIEMFEHVGPSHFVDYFKKIRSNLHIDGICVLQFSGRKSKPGAPDPWLNKYIFPGGYTPSLSETIAAIEEAGLWVSDVEVWRMHYVYTLRDWFDRLQIHRDTILNMYDEQFLRMWEFYLALCRVAFETVSQTVFQLQITRTRHATPQIRNNFRSTLERPN